MEKYSTLEIRIYWNINSQADECVDLQTWDNHIRLDTRAISCCCQRWNPLGLFAGGSPRTSFRSQLVAATSWLWGCRAESQLTPEPQPVPAQQPAGMHFPGELHNLILQALLPLLKVYFQLQHRHSFTLPPVSAPPGKMELCALFTLAEVLLCR